MTLATRIFYRKINFLNPENIPPAGPAILIANHPGSLMDAALIGLLLKRPVHFFARGDIFTSRLGNRILQALHMHPVHHHSVGRTSLNANDQSFETAIDLLNAGELVLFFPEGFSHVDYHLRPFKKGTFRLAFQAIERNQHETLPIIPIGFHYGHPTAAFRPVWIKAGKAIDARDFYSGADQPAAPAIRKLTETAYDAISELTIQTSPDKATALFYQLEIMRSEAVYLQVPPYRQWEFEKAISRNHTTISLLVQPDLNQYLELTETLSRSKSSTNPYREIIQERTGQPALLLLKTLITIPGLLLYAPPLLLAKWIADNKVSRIDFYAWILVVGAALFGLIWFIMLVLILLIVFPLKFALAAIGLLILTGLVSSRFAPCLIALRNNLRIKKIPESTMQQIRAKRKIILAVLKSFLS